MQMWNHKGFCLTTERF